MAGFNLTKSGKVDEVLHKIGISDILNESITSKSMIYKINFWSKTIETNLQKLFQDGADFDSKDRNSKGLHQHIFVASLIIGSDCWVLHKEVKIRFIMNHWILEFFGPGPYAGRWIEYRNTMDLNSLYWKWNPVHEDEFPFIEEEGSWYFRGNQPQFIWKSNTWKFMASAPMLYFQYDDPKKKTVYKISEQTSKDGQQTIQVASDSSFALAKEKMYFESADPKIVQKRDSMIAEATVLSESKQAGEKEANVTTVNGFTPNIHDIETNRNNTSQINQEENGNGYEDLSSQKNKIIEELDEIDDDLYSFQEDKSSSDIKLDKEEEAFYDKKQKRKVDHSEFDDLYSSDELIQSIEEIDQPFDNDDIASMEITEDLHSVTLEDLASGVIKLPEKQIVKGPVITTPNNVIEITNDLNSLVSGTERWEEGDYGAGYMSFAKLAINLSMSLIDNKKKVIPVKLLDLIDNVIVVEIPYNFVQIEQKVILHIESIYADNKVETTVTGTISDLNDVDEDIFTCEITLENFDQSALKQLGMASQERQNNINTFFKTVKGY